MNIKRNVISIETPEGQRGFLGPDHIARHVVYGNFVQTDPFIVLADDLLDKKDTKPVGGPHPHAGFETVSLLLEGQIGDDDLKMLPGDFQVMTAGSGIIHTETIEKVGKMRLLQLWLVLPKKDRWTKPKLQHLPLHHVPIQVEDGISIRVHSGSFAGLKSPVQNQVPLIVADITLAPGVTTIQAIPANYNTFIYMIEGSMFVGEDEKELNKDQIGWLNLETADELSELKLKAAENGGRCILYAAKPVQENITMHGPFIADEPEEIADLYHAFRMGKMKHISTVPASDKIFL
jgi:redox-sensitive bicupin YhaK (pirin superfamily)